MSEDLNLELYKKLYLIRKCEESIIKHYPEDDMKTPMHMSMGEEAIVVGIVSALKQEDQVFGSYRSHALYLSKTNDLDGFFSEMYGKSTGILQGIGGSMHLCNPEFGHFGTSAIVASSIPIAVGAAFANKKQKNDKIVVVFFGDGAIDEGCFWESINLAALYQLPIIFVCEDNNYAVHTNCGRRHGYKNIIDIISQFNINTYSCLTTDVEEVYNFAKIAIKNTPCFFYSKYYRYLEHVGIYDDFNINYRSKSEFDEWYKKDPILLQRDKLLKHNEENTLKQIERIIDINIDLSVLRAQQAIFLDIQEINNNLYV